MPVRMDQIRKKMQSLKYETDGMLEEISNQEKITRSRVMNYINDDDDYDVSTLDNHHYEAFLDIVNKDLDVDLGVEGRRMISWSWC